MLIGVGWKKASRLVRPQFQTKAQSEASQTNQCIKKTRCTGLSDYTRQDLTRATGAARDEQLGEHKTFLKASRW